MRGNKVNRERVIQLLGKGIKPATIAKRLGISRAAVSRIDAKISETTNKTPQNNMQPVATLSQRLAYKQQG